MYGMGDVAPPGLSQEMWLTYHPEFTSKVTGYTAGGTPIYQGIDAKVELAKVNAWNAYTVAPYNPSNQLANNVGSNGPAFAGALVLPTVAQPPASVQSTGQGTQQKAPVASTQSTNAPAQTQATHTQASGGTTTTAVDTGGFLGLSGMEIMIGILGIGVALMSMRKGK
jgi:hypothetical protein